jgi:hypothetical protein
MDGDENGVFSAMKTAALWHRKLETKKKENTVMAASGENGIW